MKVHVFSDSTLCVGVQNPDPSNNWTTKLEDVWNDHGFVEKLHLAAREVQFIWHISPTLDIKKRIQKYLNWQHPESCGSYSCLCSSTTLKEKETQFRKFFSNTETCLLHGAKDVAACATQFKPGHWCFQGPASENTWWNGNSNEPQRTGDTGCFVG